MGGTKRKCRRMAACAAASACYMPDRKDKLIWIVIAGGNGEMNSPMLESADTSVADYVWLPLAFDGDRVCIKWKDEWKIEDYE